MLIFWHPRSQLSNDRRPRTIGIHSCQQQRQQCTLFCGGRNNFSVKGKNAVTCYTASEVTTLWQYRNVYIIIIIIQIRFTELVVDSKIQSENQRSLRTRTTGITQLTTLERRVHDV